MKPDTDTFCAAPWFNIRNDNLGRFQCCAAIDPAVSEFQGVKHYQWPHDKIDAWANSDYQRYLRQSLSQGHRLPECHKCWTNERMGQISPRQVINQTVTKSGAWTEIYFRRKQDFKHDAIISADIKINNTCNFSCAMCKPEDSSQIYAAWMRDRQHPVIEQRLEHKPNYLAQVREAYMQENNYDLLAEIISRRPRHLKLLGGEPLLDHKTLEMLVAMDQQQKRHTQLYFVTNGSQDLGRANRMLQGFQSTHYVVSLEATGPLQDYVRRGSDWNQISSNIDQVRDQCGISVHHSLQALTMLHLPDLVTWCQQRSIPVSYGVVHDPDYLGLASIPPPLRHSISSQLGNLSLVLDEHQHRPECLDNLRRFLHWWDPQARWQSLLPEWLPYLDDNT